MTRLFWRRFRQHRLAVGSLFIIALVAVAALLAPLVESWLDVSATRADLFNRLTPPGGAHPLGTDAAGRDVLTRLLYGGRVSLAVGLVAALGAALIGSTVGLLAGYHGGWRDTVLMRLTDGIIALPLLPLLVVLAAIDLNRLPLPAALAGSPDLSLYRIIVIIALVGWTTVARLVRAATLSVRTRDYVTAARALGASSGRIMLRHILPNVASPVIVATTLSVGGIMLLESVLSFLGVGVQPPIPTWGNMLTNAQELLTAAPWLAIFPGAAIFVTVMAFNFVGDGLQDAMTPRRGEA